MATYYVRKSGNNSNAGTSAGAAWLTIGKALASGASPVAGDTIYVGPGVYREAVTAAISGSSGNPINYIADTDGSHTGDAPGPVIWTPYTTNDTTAPASSAPLNAAARTWLSFTGFTMIGGGTAPQCVNMTSGTRGNTFTDCEFLCGRGSTAIEVVATTGTPLDLTFNRCRWFGIMTYCCYFTCPTNTSADYDVNAVFNNCAMYTVGNAVMVDTSGAGSFKAGGVDMNYCDVFAGNQAMRANTTNLSTSIPCTVNKCKLICGGTALQASTSGQITEDYNYIAAATARSNVSTGTNSKSGSPPAYAMLVDIGQALRVGQPPLHFLTPTESSPLLGFVANLGTLTTDLLNRPRPSGGASIIDAVGALERHDFAVQETSVVDASGSGFKMTGPGDHDIYLVVDAAATVISIKGRYDTNHGTGSKPQVMLLDNDDLGVSAQTLTMTAAVDTWETLTFSSITPTAKGLVRIRLVSRAAAGNGIAYFDTLAVA